MSTPRQQKEGGCAYDLYALGLEATRSLFCKVVTEAVICLGSSMKVAKFDHSM